MNVKVAKTSELIRRAEELLRDMEAPPMEGEAAITEPVEKAGAVLNRTNRDKLGRAIALLQEVLTSAEKPADETPKGVDTEIIREACKALREELEIK